MESSGISLDQLRTSWPASAEGFLATAQNGDVSSRDIVRALQFIDCAKRHLTPEELVVALSVDTINHCLDEKTRSRLGDGKKLLASCRDVLTVRPITPVGQTPVYWDKAKNGYQANAVHQVEGEGGCPASSNAAWLRDAHAELAMTCMSYLESLEYSADSRARQPSAFFGVYSAKYWPSHVKEAGDGDEGLKMRAQSFLETPAAVENWLLTHDVEDDALWNLPVPRRYDWYPAGRSPLYHAVFHGLRGVTTGLLAAASVMQDSDRERNLEEALYAACFRGDMESARLLLLDYGVSPNAGYGPFDSVLAAAVAGRDVQTVKLLLERGARVPHDVDSGHPLAIATLYGHRDMVEVIARAGGEVEGEGEDHQGWGGKSRQHVLDYCLRTYCTRLVRGQEKSGVILEMLLRAGANPLARDVEGKEDGETALEAVLQRWPNSAAFLVLRRKLTHEVLAMLRTEQANLLRLAMERETGQEDIAQLLREKLGAAYEPAKPAQG